MNFKFQILNFKLTINPWLLLIIIFFLISRLYKIDSIPPSLYWDEASIGYNAYSILKTGHDEWGETLPLEFKAFGEYKLPVYIYSLVPFEAILGLEAWVVRLPAVLYSLGSVVLLYFLGKKIFENQLVGWLAAFLFSISPWFFIFSRSGFEATAGVFFYLLGLLFFLQKRSWLFLGLSILSFIICLYSYNSFRIVTLPTVIILFCLYFREIKLNKNHWVILVIFLLITFLTLFKASQMGVERLNDIGIFNTSDKKVIAKNFVNNYLSHFSQSFIFNGDKNLRSQQPDFGQVYLLEIVFILSGIIFIFKSKKWMFKFPLILSLIAIIPAAITRESPHGLRTVAAVPFFSVIGAYGIYRLNQIVKLKFFLFSTVFLFTIFFINYLLSFISSYSLKSSDQWQYGYKKIFTDYGQNFNQFDHIIISDYYNQPYIFALFYLKYDPDQFNQLVKRNITIRKETSLVRSFEKFVFTSINFYDFPLGKSLIFAHPSERMDEINYKETINNLDGSLAFYVYEYEKN